MSRSSTTVPLERAAGFTSLCRPPETAMLAPSSPSTRLVMVRRPTAPSEGRASPRKPKEWMLSRSEPSILLVAWRDNASGKSGPEMPQPSSVTRIRVLPPSAITTSIRCAPASTAFSTNSFTAEAGRSKTSPAAIRLIAASSSCLMTGRGFIWGSEMAMPQGLA